ncbi:putative inositol monophosphatase 3 [Dendroctonus ponderosae]|uniref:putative inositol monophosphatase 3 n=1 Tax=Dendroctonus ponderosae TaxID=77166 RepID=UPI002035A9D9|nr:putative inositol monophosphatase 3 [Dendroctonus ponderosae]XP_048525397.1 putative inositol monophosphatase 3 [Dendroctonus ponderosae]
MNFSGIIKLNKRAYCVLFLLAVVFVYLQFFKAATSENVSLFYMLEVAIHAAQAGGSLVVSTRNNLKIHSKGKTAEGKDDSVTSADYFSHCAMLGIITRALPQVTLISEENGINCKKESAAQTYNQPLNLQFDYPAAYVEASDVTIWIDPLDATVEYTEKLYQYVTTMVCVAVNGKPIIGVIHQPFNESTSWAVVGFGHSANLNEKVHGTDSNLPKIIISRSHSGTIEQTLKTKFKDFKLIVAAGAGYKALRVADNTADAYLHSTAIKKWDICAGNAILSALGGKMTTKHGQTLTYYNDTNVINKEGLVATLRNHEAFIDKL